jgi:PHD/YefM family antitoxin component YafN of YafNO toxin-antitoxin module
MPKILPISDLRNYTAVLSQVDVDKPVYLTRNGRGTYVISKIDDYDRDETVEELLKEIQKGEKSLTKDGGIPLGEVAKKYNISL